MLKCSYFILEMPPRVNHESLPCSRVYDKQGQTETPPPPVRPDPNSPPDVRK